jgi:hypothetical protein
MASPAISISLEQNPASTGEGGYEQALLQHRLTHRRGFSSMLLSPRSIYRVAEHIWNSQDRLPQLTNHETDN